MSESPDSERILIVEDNAATRKLAARMLSSLGYRVDIAKDAEEAIGLLRTEQFDILFTDIVMPGERDGIALARDVRKNHPDIHIIFTSGFSEMNPQDIEELRATYVTKPYRKTEIAKILRDVISQ